MLMVLFFSIKLNRLTLRIVPAGLHSEHGELDLNMSVILSAVFSPQRRNIGIKIKVLVYETEKHIAKDLP